MRKPSWLSKDQVCCLWRQLCASQVILPRNQERQISDKKSNSVSSLLLLPPFSSPLPCLDTFLTAASSWNMGSDNHLRGRISNKRACLVGRGFWDRLQEEVGPSWWGETLGARQPLAPGTLWHRHLSRRSLCSSGNRPHTVSGANH